MSHLALEYPFSPNPTVPNLPGYGFQRDTATIQYSPAEELYDKWPTPTCIIVDGPYGLSGFPGDLPTVEGLTDWYRPHVAAWSERSTPQTTLWFWNSEIGWATVHPLFLEFGWEYRGCHIWDKGIGHVAGNANTQTLRKFPVTTEVCVQYVQPARFRCGDAWLTMQEWLRAEWNRSGLPLKFANEACGVLNAATRKYLTADHLWYYPPPEAFERLSKYVNQHGRPAGRPYLGIDGVHPIDASQWSQMRAKFNCPPGITNVWTLPHVGGHERVGGERRRAKWKFKSLHGSQKPLKLIETLVQATTDPGDVIWEPFGGLCPAAICAWRLGRNSYSAQIVQEFYDAAVLRLSHERTPTY